MNTPPSPTSASSAFRVEPVISGLLRWGVAISLVLLTVGTILCFVRTCDYGQAGGTAADFHRLLAQRHAPPSTFHATVRGLLHLQSEALILTGLVLLIATPVLRVAVSIVAFACEKDRAFVCITTVVFLLLLLSFALGKVG